MTFEMKLQEERRHGFQEGKEEGIAEGMAAGRTQGIALGKANAVIELLHERGPIEAALSEHILQETDGQTLKRWLILAATASSVEEFIEEAELCTVQITP